MYFHTHRFATFHDSIAFKGVKSFGTQDRFGYLFVQNAPVFQVRAGARNAIFYVPNQANTWIRSRIDTCCTAKTMIAATTRSVRTQVWHKQYFAIIAFYTIQIHAHNIGRCGAVGAPVKRTPLGGWTDDGRIDRAPIALSRHKELLIEHRVAWSVFQHLLYRETCVVFAVQKPPNRHRTSRVFGLHKQR